MNISEILRNHQRMYPKMQPIDAVKLIYQNEFGGGHLIADAEKSLEYLLSEAERTPSNESLPLAVPIGNGLVRVNIAAVTNYRLDFVQLNDIFVESAELVVGSMESFIKKLEALKKLTVDGVFEFGSDELEKYLAEYQQAGYPMVSHSAVYRESYAPAYRVVLESLLEKSERAVFDSADMCDCCCAESECLQEMPAFCEPDGN